MMTDNLFQKNLERIARARIGQQAQLDYPLSPYHGQSGRIVETMTMHDGQLVHTVECASGVRLHLLNPGIGVVEN